jgi:hypothetical protein
MDEENPNGKKEENSKKAASVLEADLVDIGGYRVDLAPYSKVGEYSASLVHEIMLTFNKNLSSNEVESKYDQFSQFFNNQNLKVTNAEIQKILNAIGLIEIHHNMHNLLWSGPDCLNPFALTHICLRENPFVKQSVSENFQAYLTNYPYELSTKESAFFHKFYVDFMNSLKADLDPRWFSYTSESFQEFREVKQFEEHGFAVLKNDKLNYYLKKTYVIIGRKADSPFGKYDWDVDLNLENNPKVSKQHALIVFNFQKGQFELVCLSAKNHISVNKKILKLNDSPYPLHDESIIKFAGETFYFFLPAIVH